MNHTLTFMNVKKFSLILGKGHSVNYVQLCEQCHDCILVSFMCILYNQQDANLYSFLYYYRRSTCFGRVFCPSSGACKTVCSHKWSNGGRDSRVPATIALSTPGVHSYPPHVMLLRLFTSYMSIVCTVNRGWYVEISTPTHPYQFILILLISVKPDDGRFWPKHVVS